MKEKADIAKVADKAREKAKSEAAEKAKAWSEAKSKEKSVIDRLSAKESEKAEA